MAGNQRKKSCFFLIREGKKVHQPFKPLEVISAWGGSCNKGRVVTRSSYHFVCSSVMRGSSDQSTDPWYLEHRVFFTHPGFCKLWEGYLLQEHVHSSLPWGWTWRVGNCYCVKSCNWHKWKFIIQAFLWKLQAFNTFQSLKILISERFCWCNCLDGEDEFLVFLTYSSSQNNSPHQMVLGPIDDPRWMLKLMTLKFYHFIYISSMFL